MQFVDCHNDFLGEMNENQIKRYMSFCVDCGAKFVSSSFWTTHKINIIEQIEQKSKLIKSNKKFGLQIEDLHFVEDENQLNSLLMLNPFSCSLTWNYSNCLAGGSLSEKDLTCWGKRCVEQLEKHDVLVDCAHLNKKSFYSLLDVVQKPLYCSHSGFNFIKYHPRNLSDDQIDQIIRTQGFVGMYFFKDNILDRGVFDVNYVANCFVRFADRFGCQNIGIGSDFYGIDVLPKNLENYSKLNNLAVALNTLGVSQKEIEKLFYENFDNFISRCR